MILKKENEVKISGGGRPTFAKNCKWMWEHVPAGHQKFDFLCTNFSHN